MTAEDSVRVKINGKDRTVPEGLHVAGLLSLLQVTGPGVAVERNRSIVPKTNYESTPVEAGDEIEIVSFIGGG